MMMLRLMMITMVKVIQMMIKSCTPPLANKSLADLFVVCVADADTLVERKVWIA
jgi:hypothetical protein